MILPIVSLLILVLVNFVNYVQAGFFMPQANEVFLSKNINNNTEVILNVYSQTECILVCERITKSESFLTNDGKCLCSEKFKMISSTTMKNVVGNDGEKTTNFRGQIFKKVLL